MAISISCPHCEGRLRAPDTSAGKKIRCPKCQEVVKVPWPPEEEKQEAPERRTTTVRKPKAAAGDDGDERTTTKARRPKAIDEEQPRPKKRKRAARPASNLPLILGIGGGALVLLLAGVGGLIWWLSSGNKNAKDQAATGTASQSRDAGSSPKGGERPADLPRLKPVARFQLPGKNPRFVASRNVQVSLDGKRVALACSTADYKNLTQVWELGPQPRVIFNTPPDFLAGTTFALSPSGKRLLVQREAFDVDTGKSLGKANDHFPGFTHGFLRDDNVAVFTTRSFDYSKATKGKIYLWDVVNNADAGTFEIADNRFSDVYLMRGGTELWLFQSAKRFEVECYDLSSGKLSRTIKPEPENPNDPYQSSGIYCAVAPDGTAFTSQRTKFRFYDGSSGKNVGQLPKGLWGMADSFITTDRTLTHASPDFGGGVSEEDLVLIDWKTSRALAVLNGFAPPPRDPQKLPESNDPHAGASADGKTVVLVSRSGEVLVFDLSAVK